LDVHRVAEAGIGIDDERQFDGIPGSGDVRREFGQAEKPYVWRSEEGVGDAGAGEVDSLEADFFSNAGGQGVGGAGEQQRRPAGGDAVTEDRAG